MAERKRQEEERRAREVEEKKQREQEEKMRRLEEVERKRQLMVQAQKVPKTQNSIRIKNNSLRKVSGFKT